HDRAEEIKHVGLLLPVVTPMCSPTPTVSFLAQRRACQRPQRGCATRANRRGCYVLSLTPGAERPRDDRATFGRHSDDARACVLLAWLNFHPGRALDQREIARQRSAFSAKRLGQLADRHRAAQ